MYKIKENITFELIEKEAIIVDMNTGRFLNTNLTGYCILKALESGDSVEKISLELSEKFKLTYDSANKIIADFLKLLTDNEIIVFYED